MKKIIAVLGLVLAFTTAAYAADGTPTQDDIVIGPDAIRYYLGKLQLGDRLGVLLDRVVDARIHRTDRLELTLTFTQASDIQLADPDTVANWKLYGIHVPATVFVPVKIDDGVLTITGLNQGDDIIKLLVKIPVLSHEVVLHGATADLSTGDLLIEAGAVSDLFTVVAKANFLDPKFGGVDFWDSLAANLDFSIVPPAGLR
jgi:hypothetical protein